MRSSISFLGSCLATLPLLACAMDDPPLTASGYTAEEEAIFRVESCVRGGMPKEVQFITDGSPPSLADQASIDSAAVVAVSAALDAQIGALLADAAGQVWNGASGIDEAEKFEDLLFDFHRAIVATAPQRMALAFCGDQEQVGEAIASTLASWFDRALQPTNESDAMRRWLTSIGPRGTAFGAAFLQLAVSLRLAGIDYELEELARGFKRFAAASG